MAPTGSVAVAPILREHDGGIHDDHPLLTRSVQHTRVIDLNVEAWALVCGADGVTVEGEPDSYASRAPEDCDGVVWTAETICRHGSRVKLGGTPIVQRVDNDARVARWSRIDIYRQVLNYEIPRLLALDITANPWIGRLIIYRLLEVTEADRGHDYGAAHLSSNQRAWVAHRLREILTRIPPSIIEDYQVTSVAPNRLAALLAVADGTMPAPTLMADTPTLPVRRVSVFHPAGTSPDDHWRVDGEPVQVAHVKTIDHQFFDDVFVHERIAWLPRGTVELVRDGTTLTTGVHRRRRPPVINPPSFAARLVKAVSWRSRKAINAYASAWMKRLINNEPKVASDTDATAQQTRQPVWLYMDRHNSAGDNAEPLYRYASHHVPGVRHIFALERTSEDWERLQADGFALVDIHADEFDQAWTQADALLLADIGDPAAHLRLTGKRTRRDQRVVFLQHGVTMRDMWRWMNGKRIDVMIAATPVEYHALVDDHTSYTLTEPEVWLTGFPRHDLLHPMLGRDRDRIVLAPTWRVSLVHGLEEHSGDYTGLNAVYAPWIALARRLHEAGKRVTLFIHPKIALLAPAWVDGLDLDTTTGRDVPEQLSRAIATVSDRSSILDDAMLLGGVGIVWDPTQSPDTDHYRQMHVNVGALEARSARAVIDFVDEAERGILRISSAVTIPDDQARRRIVERLLAAGLGPSP
ncbi:CDP-glycerol glycerophosphotransferase family protein [Actinomyces mediterranea]|uniref:CDP-glycerol glycerophosphotransferase family protein n=1 Tax=Actinomyces mediterranea TaxID=1871028 RepID=UPI0009713BF7|nr:CDP-glycerol glycerophosphotransferase family protein [Actinomyces mediterranea]